MARPREMQAFYEGWAEQHRRIVETIRPLTPELHLLRAVPTEWAIWQLAANMAGGRMYWFCFMLGEDDQGVGPEWTGWEDDPEHPRTADETVEAFARTWKVVQASLDRWTLQDLAIETTRNNFWGKPTIVSPASVIQRVMSHEFHHGSEISLILRAHGLPTLLNM